MEILTELNPVQQEAVSFDTNTPLAILAGAGSGKTRILTHRVAYFVKELGIDRQNILLLTFTNKAAGEMLYRVSKLTGDAARSGIAGGTFHSFGVKVLREFGGVAGIRANFSIFDESDQLDTIKRAMESGGVDPKTVKPSSVAGAISEAKNNLISPNDYASFARGSFSQGVAKVYLVYEQMLRRYNAFDFDDLLVRSVQLIKTYPQVKQALQERYTHILIDEYQDTNKAQYELTKMLAEPGHLTVVGDASQAIYSWRGADYKNLLYLKQDFPNLKVIRLEQNYRSTQNLLDAANAVIAKNTSHPILELWTENPTGEKIKITEYPSEYEEARAIADEINVLSQMKKTSLQDVAVLYRTNAQSRVLEEALLQAGIPYHLVGGVRFYERKEIKDVLAYAKILVNPSDEVSRKRAGKLGKARLARLEEKKIDVTRFTTLEVLSQIFKLTGYLETYDSNSEEDAVRLENIDELKSVALLYPKIDEFLQQITLTEKEAKKKMGRSRNEMGAVTMMTLHASKGLEFDVVFLVGMEEGLFPHSRALNDPEQMEEERRLCYVGMTRTRKKLYITYARNRLIFGQRSPGIVSRFVADIPEKVIDNFQVLLTAKKVDQSWGFDENGEWRWQP